VAFLEKKRSLQIIQVCNIDRIKCKMIKTSKTVTTYASADSGDPTVDPCKARLVRALAQGNKNYTIRTLRDNVYHIKTGHLWVNIVFGCCGQCYKYDVDFSNPQMVMVHSTVQCNGWWGGAIGACMEADEDTQVKYLLQKEFSDRRVV
jgi:hypothetical protein